MSIRIGQIEAIFRYPVKSMAGQQVEEIDMGWQGLEADRRLAFCRAGERGGFPWLTATRLPELLLYAPVSRGGVGDGSLPTHIRTPEGRELEASGPELADDIEERLGAPVELMHLRDGIFDEAAISVITESTVNEIGRLAESQADVRRFRPNIFVRLDEPGPFQEDAWVGSVLVFGDSDENPCVSVTMRDPRCAMVNYDPDSCLSTPAVLKGIVRENQNNAGVYGTVIRTGRLAVGQEVRLHKLAVE